MRRLLLIPLMAVLLLAGCWNPDPATIPPPEAGSSTLDIAFTGNFPDADTADPTGAFRTNCAASHYGQFDPIVAPGQPDVGHWHMFFGNTGVDPYSTSETIASSGNSTCMGGTANRSAYWTPAMLDITPNDPDYLYPLVEPWQDANPYLADNGVQVYYKTGYNGVRPEDIVPFPAGLRIIAGMLPTATTAPTDNEIVEFYCLPPGVFAPYGHGLDIQRPCNAGDTLVQRILFPQCWDGVNLDSPNHRDHMAYGQGVEYPWPPGPEIWHGCPETHPVALPEITVNVRYLVPFYDGPDEDPLHDGVPPNWRLASDAYNDPHGGWTSHADWVNGWDPEVMERIVTECLNPGFNCQMNLIGDGEELV
jgi:hypothetical protein